MFRPEGIEDAAVPGRAAAMRNFSRIRDRLFYALFHKLSHTYAKIFPPPVRRCFEFIIFIKALFAIAFLIYMHTIFSNSPLSCLEPVQPLWPKYDGILRIEVVSNLSYSPQLVLRSEEKAESETPDVTNEMVTFQFENSTDCPNVAFYRHKSTKNPMSWWFDALFDNSVPTLKEKLMKPDLIFEYALEYGFLRLSTRVRKKLGIKVVTLRIDPDVDECFGTGLSRYVRREVLGVEDWLRNSFKVLAFEEDNKQGYLRNVNTDEHFKFISVHATRSSYIAAAFVMVLFTLSISMLLRYSHHQIFIFIIDVLQMLELNIGMVFPAAPLLTVILALVGIEAIMSEFFSDSTTAFYIIIIVWVADQYEAICCHTNITRRYWLRFFYLYHFAFYAYHYRFNGQYSGLALVASWLLIQHSMLYFFHHYELPAVLNRTAVMQAQTRNIHNHHHHQHNLDAPGSSPQTDETAQGNVQDTNTQSSSNTPPRNPQHGMENIGRNTRTSGESSIVDPTSLEYIEHLLEELIPARNGIVANDGSGPSTWQMNSNENGNQDGNQAAGRSEDVNLNNNNNNNDSRDESSGPDRSPRSGAAVRSPSPIVSNVALYPFQTLIVSLLIRLLNFIQTGSPRRVGHGSHPPVIHNRNGRVPIDPTRGIDLLPAFGMDSGNNNTREVAISSTDSNSIRNLTRTLTAGHLNQSQQHRRTQSANGISGISSRIMDVNNVGTVIRSAQETSMSTFT